MLGRLVRLALLLVRVSLEPELLELGQRQELVLGQQVQLALDLVKLVVLLEHLVVGLLEAFYCFLVYFWLTDLRLVKAAR